MNAHPLSWLKQVQEELHLAQKIPLWGAPPTFPWEEFSSALQMNLQIRDLTVLPQKRELTSPEHFLTSFGEKPVVKTLELAPLDGMIYFILSSESLERITSLVLSSEVQDKKFVDPELQEGFFQYLLLCAAESFNNLAPYPDLHVQWLETKKPPLTSSFCCDLSLTLHSQTFPARLIFSSSFHQDFSKHFAKKPQDLFSSSLTDVINLSLKVEAGSCLLAKKDWDRLNVGDFLVLDRCSYDPLLQKGTLTLSLEKTPLFTMKLKKGKLKILDYCTYYGDNNTMDEDEDLDSLFPDEEKEIDEELDLDSVEDLEDEDSVEEVEEEKPQETPTMKEKLSSSLEIPFPITVEIDRISMPLKNLLSLEPGNILELPMQPEQGVYLTVHGKKIAKGELIKLGDAIGVKIVEIGESSSL